MTNIIRFSESSGVMHKFLLDSYNDDLETFELVGSGKQTYVTIDLLVMLSILPLNIVLKNTLQNYFPEVLL